MELNLGSYEYSPKISCNVCLNVTNTTSSKGENLHKISFMSRQLSKEGFILVRFLLGQSNE